MPSTTPDPKHAEAFAARRTNRWRELRRRWPRVVFPIGLLIALIPLAFVLHPEPLAPPHYAHVRVVNDADRTLLYVNLDTARGSYLVGVMDRGESHTYALEDIRMEEVSLRMRSDVLATCCESLLGENQRVVFRAVDPGDRLQWIVETEPLR